MKRKLVIEREVMENEIENKNEIKVQTKYWYECLHWRRQHKSQINKVIFLNSKLVIENEVMENEIKNEIKVKVKTKYWHKCRHSSHRHSTKTKWNKIQ